MANPQFPLSVVIKAVDRITGPAARMAAQVSGRVRSIARAAGLPAITAAGTRLVSSVRTLGQEVSRTALRFGGLVAAASAAGFGIVRSYATAGDEISKTSERLGIGVQALQELRFAADRSGISTGTLEMALQRAGRRIAEAANGMGEARVALDALKIQARDAMGNVKTLEQIMPEFLDKFSRIKSAGERNALAMKLFDSEGVAMVQLLSLGRAGFAKLVEEAHKYGRIMTEEEVAATVAFIDAQTNMQTAILGVRNVIGTALLPQLQALIERTTAWVVENRDRINAFARDFAAGLPERIASISRQFREVAEFLEPVVNLGRAAVDRFGVLKVGLVTLAAVIGGPLVVALIAATAAAIKMSVALVANPVGLILIGIVALVAGVVWLWRNWDKVTTGMMLAWELLKSLYARTPGWVRKALFPMVEIGIWTVKNWDKIVESFRKVWASIRETFGSGVAWVRDKVNALRSWLPSWLGGTDEGGAVPSEFRVEVNADRVAAAAGQSSTRIEQRESRVRVQFENLPEGARVTQSGDRDVPLETELGYALEGF